MGHPFEHPTTGRLLKRVAHSYRSGSTYIVRNANILFVCGGHIHDSTKMRSRFCDFAKENLTDFRLFLAEDAQKDYLSHLDSEFLNVAKFEENISEISDCIVLFPESPGSHAELGYFAQSKPIRSKLLVVNDASLQGQDSFISLGPIEIIDRHSRFKPTIQVSGADDSSFLLIKKRLEQRLSSGRRRRLTAGSYKDLSFRDKFYFVFEIVRIFQVITYSGIRYAFQSIWGNVKKDELYRILSILVAAEYVRRHPVEPEFFCINREIEPFLEAKQLNVNAITLEIADAYNRHFPAVADMMRQLGR